MDITKEAVAARSGAPTAAQLDAINRLSKTALTADDVYVFSLRLCDDQPDRDGERFDTAALPQLANMFVGKTGILDHRWTSSGQVARIFDAYTVQEDRVSFIKAWAYIRRGDETNALIADIEAGIKKEVSVGCAMGKAVCSVCGSEYGSCGHQKGAHYDGQLCCAILRDPVDAYEFSFVAVPAQKDAGVLKGMGGNTPHLKELAAEFGAGPEYRALCKDAALGRQYAQQVRSDVVRLCLSLELGVEEPVLRALTETAGSAELICLRDALQKRLDESLPVQVQLATRPEGEVESGFLI